MEFFRSNVNEQQYQTWFVPTKFNSYNNKTHVLSVCIPSHFYYEYLEQHFRKLLHVGIFKYFGDNAKLTYKVKMAADATVKQESDNAPFIAQNQGVSRDATTAPGVMSAADLEAIAEVLRGTDVMVLSDEIYAELTFGGGRHTAHFDSSVQYAG